MAAPRRRPGPPPGPLQPHPLIWGLAVGVDGNLEDAMQAAAFWTAQPPGPPPPWGTGWTDALNTFSKPQRAKVVVFAGYLGPAQTDRFPDHQNVETWRLLYEDAKARRWLMVPESAIVLCDRRQDRKAAFGLRDYIWVRADAPVRQGRDEESDEARFLVGTFTCASDLHDALSHASPASAGSGILCAPTPECCRHGTN